MDEHCSWPRWSSSAHVIAVALWRVEWSNYHSEYSMNIIHINFGKNALVYLINLLSSGTANRYYVSFRIDCVENVSFHNVESTYTFAAYSFYFFPRNHNIICMPSIRIMAKNLNDLRTVEYIMMLELIIRQCLNVIKLLWSEYRRVSVTWVCINKW